MSLVCHCGEVILKKIAIFNDTRPDHHYGCQLVMKNLFELLRSNNMDPVWCWPVGKNWHSEKGVIPKKGDIDAVIVNGEGSIHHSSTRPRANWLASVGEFSYKELGVPAFLINASLEENSSELYEKLRFYKRIYVRESKSLKELNDYGLAGDVVPDLTMAFLVEGKANRNGLLFTDSVLPDVSAELIKMASQLNGDCVGLRYREKPILKDLKNPFKFSANFVKWFVSEKKGMQDVNYFLSKLYNCEMLVTGRFHAVTLSLLTECPFVAIESNTGKIGALLDDVFDDRSRLFDFPEMSENLDFFTVRGFSSKEICQIRSYLNNGRVKIKNMFREIYSDIN